MGLIHDPGAAKRSLMYQQKSLCNGEKTGRCCAFYWTHWEKVESNNPDALKRGEIFRVCTFSPDIAHEMSAEQLGTRCNQYVPMRLPLWKRPLAWLRFVFDPGRYDTEFESYDPLTPEEIKQLQEDFPTPPSDVETAYQEGLVQLQRGVEKRGELSLDEAMSEIDDDNEAIFGGQATSYVSSDDNSNGGDQGIFAKEEE